MFNHEPRNVTSKGGDRALSKQKQIRGKQAFHQPSLQAWLGFGMTAILGLVAVQSVWAEEGATSVAELTETLAAHARAIDTVWVLVCAFLVFFMQAGFALVESGFTRSKNALNILMKNLMDYCLGSLAFWAVGFALMFGTGNLFVGTRGFFLTGDPVNSFLSLDWANVPLAAKFLFQLVFAATAATIVSGAMAERTKYKSYLVYSVVITAVIYPISGHWIWGGGWLAELGMWDFAGSTVVHSVGGWLALWGAIALGPRLGKYTAEGKPRAIPGHNLPMAALGTFILWLGWFGFNPGSTMAGLTDHIAYIALTTNVAAAAGCLVAMALSWMLYGKPDIGLSLNGALAGLVAITAPCAFVGPASAVVIGAFGGVLMIFAVAFFDKVGVDDPVGAISVHGVCGAFGTIALGLFAQESISPGTVPNGLLFGGGFGLLGAQLAGVGAVFAWCAVTGLPLFFGIKALMGLRVTVAEEREGLDHGEHGGTAYPEFEIVPSTLPYDSGRPAAGSQSVPAAEPAPASQPAPGLKPVAAES